jgi:hypothetical protein
MVSDTPRQKSFRRTWLAIFYLVVGMGVGLSIEVSRVYMLNHPFRIIFIILGFTCPILRFINS